MATPSDVSRIAQIVALMIEQGKDAQAIDARLDRLGIDPGSQAHTRAIMAGSLAREFAVALTAGDYDTAELNLARLRGLGASEVVVLGNAGFWPAHEPKDAQGDPVLTYRRFKQTYGAELTAEQIRERAIGYAEAMATGVGHDTPGYGTLEDVTFEFGAPQ